jgi:hypothetical protein
MDLSTCKLVCRSRSKALEKPANYKYWESSAIESNLPLKPKNQKIGVSRSAPRFMSMLRKQESRSSPFVGLQSTRVEVPLRKNVSKLSPVQFSTEKILNRVQQNIPAFQSVVNIRNFLKPHKLVPIRKKREEETFNVIELTPPPYRVGYSGSKFTKLVSKSQKHKPRVPKVIPKVYEKESSDSARWNHQYREPYIQLIMNKKSNDLNCLFNNRIDI